MILNEILKENPDINITISARELLEFGQLIADNTVSTYIQKHDEKVFSRDDVMNKFKICSATLWRWDKNNLIRSTRIGNRVFYPESEVKRLLNQKGGSNDIN